MVEEEKEEVGPETLDLSLSVTLDPSSSASSSPSRNGRAAPSPPPPPPPSIAPLSLSFSSSLYSALCRDSSRAETEVGLLTFRDYLLEHCSTRSLVLRGFGVGHSASTILLQFLLHSDECRAVQQIDLQNNDLRSFGLTQMLKAIQRKDSAIQSLAVGDNGIGRAGAKEMANVLVNNTTVNRQTHTDTHSHPPAH
jgi:hypothetical protein